MSTHVVLLSCFLRIYWITSYSPGARTPVRPKAPPNGLGPRGPKWLRRQRAAGADRVSQAGTHRRGSSVVNGLKQENGYGASVLLTRGQEN